MARTVLVVDDEAAVRSSIAGVLGDEGYRVLTASDGATALELISHDLPDVILLDVWMTGPNGERQQEGLETLGRVKSQHPDAIVVIMSGHGTIETAVKATKLGAYDFIEKPLSLEKLLVTLQNAFQLRDLSRENQSLRSRVERTKVMVGESPTMKQLKQAIRRVAATNSWVLITGENGTGKELVAHSIHALSGRYDKPFIEVNCAAIPEELIESELFGHEKGSFTGATHLKRGKFDLANRGTLFLDEIGDMSLKTQAKILRILQEQRFERVGGSHTIEVDVRVIAATNKNLEEEIRNNKFREDLYYRLNVVPFRVPALRERGEDIKLIASHYLKEFAGVGCEPKQLHPEALRVFETYHWPGNVRELKNTIERLVIFSDSSVITAEELVVLMPHLVKSAVPQALPGSGAYANPQTVVSLLPTGSLKDAKSEFEREFILRKLRENEWNVSRTAQVLGIERSHLHRKIKAYGIDERLSD
ncbi:MAG: sigma-54 dependent transcriptional regulator [Bdellovibrionota bacterium]